MNLTDRQRREVEYHKEHAETHKSDYRSISYDVINSKNRRWWNAYWSMYDLLLAQEPLKPRVLVVGCGFGEDAFRLAKMGAQVSACDLSPDVLEVARRVAERERLSIDFRQMAVESMEYETGYFETVLIRDILHHVDVPRAVTEIIRVCKRDALMILNEVYSHSITNKIRYSAVVDKWLYPRLVNFVYQGKKPYITEDEAKLCEVEIAEVVKHLRSVETRYFNFLTARIIPSSFELYSRMDTMILKALKPIGHYLAGRILLKGFVTKP